MKLYHYALSGHAHRAALFLSLAGVAHELIEVDLAVGAHKQPEFLAINAFGEVPVLDDGGVIISDSLAILVYIARKIGPSHWLPTDAADEARVQRWLSVAAGKIAYGACAARLITVFGATFNAKEVIERAHATLTVMEQTLQTQRWIAGAEDPSIADVALYSYVERAPEGNVDLSGYPKVQAWLRDIECLPGFTPFQRSQAGLYTPNEPPSSDAINLSFDKLRLDHIGLRVTDLGVAEAFYAKLGFKRDPEEFAPEFKASGLVHPTGLRLHLIYNGEAAEEGNVLLDAPIKWPGYTHAAFIIDGMAELVRWLHSEGINISQGPVTMGRGRRNVCFIRDPDLNVLEFNEILEA